MGARRNRNEEDQMCCPPAGAIYDPPQYVVNDFFHPQEVPIIHTTEIINQHHCVPVPHHFHQYKVTNVMGNGFRGKRK